jgi:hypothetical protein
MSKSKVVHTNGIKVTKENLVNIYQKLAGLESDVKKSLVDVGFYFDTNNVEGMGDFKAVDKWYLSFADGSDILDKVSDALGKMGYDCDDKYNFRLREGHDVPEKLLNGSSNTNSFKKITFDDLFVTRYINKYEEFIDEVKFVPTGTIVVISSYDWFEKVRDLFKNEISSFDLIEACPLISYDMRIIGGAVKDHCIAHTSYDGDGHIGEFKMFEGTSNYDLIDRFCPNLVTHGNWKRANVPDSLFKSAFSICDVYNKYGKLSDAIIKVYMEGNTPMVECMNGLFDPSQMTIEYRFARKGHGKEDVSGNQNKVKEAIATEFVSLFTSGVSDITEAYIVLSDSGLNYNTAIMTGSPVKGEKIVTIF